MTPPCLMRSPTSSAVKACAARQWQRSIFCPRPICRVRRCVCGNDGAVEPNHGLPATSVPQLRLGTVTYHITSLHPPRMNSAAGLHSEQLALLDLLTLARSAGVSRSRDSFVV